MSKNTGLWADKRGMVSFLVTMIMMIVITLIVVGFSEVTRRNEREALDRQLSAQAFYAAESGVNATVASIKNFLTTNSSANLPTKTGCASDYDPTAATGNGGAIIDLNHASNVRYTCVLVNPRPSSLQFSASQQASTVTPINIDGGLDLKTLTVKWSLQDGGTKTTCAGTQQYNFAPMSTWGSDCDLGVLRLDIVQDPNENATNAGNLANNTISVFLTPRGPHDGNVTVGFGGSTVAYVASGRDAGGSGACDSGACQVTINFPNSANNYEIRATTLYKDSKTVTITGTVTGDAIAHFSGAQAVVDVTGQDQDELRRIQARVALTATGSSIPANAVSSTNSICKHFSILPTDSLDLSTADACN